MKHEKHQVYAGKDRSSAGNERIKNTMYVILPIYLF